MQSTTTSAAPGNSLPAPSLDSDLRELQQLIEQRRFDDALASSDRLLEQFPGHRDLLYMRAVALRHLQRVPDALATLEMLEDTHPAYPRLFQERGHCHVFLNQAPEAIQAVLRDV
jgi:tetratricopeptide (TPR) repeat protein